MLADKPLREIVRVVVNSCPDSGSPARKLIDITHLAALEEALNRPEAKKADGVEIILCERMDDVLVVGTSCRDADDFVRLPRAVEFDGKLLGRSGWNSDRCLAYYRSDRAVATRSDMK